MGDLTLDYESLTVAGDPEQSLGLHTAAPGSPSEQGLRLLASWASDPVLPDPLPPAHPGAPSPPPDGSRRTGVEYYVIQLLRIR